MFPLFHDVKAMSYFTVYRVSLSHLSQWATDSALVAVSPQTSQTSLKCLGQQTESTAFEEEGECQKRREKGKDIEFLTKGVTVINCSFRSRLKGLCCSYVSQVSVRLDFVQLNAVNTLALVI